MDGEPLGIDGAFVFTPTVHGDDRGAFLEAFRADVLEKVTGRPLWVAQTNTSVSVAGSLRGIHFAELPPGQAKYISCTTGAVLDVVVDIRVGSPTFGQWDSVVLDDRSRKAVFISEGLGHAFMALEPNATVTYLCSAPYAPGHEHGINPLDPEIGIEWPTARPALLSPKDQAAPSLAEMEGSGLLPTYDEAVAWVEGLREG